MHRRTVLAGSGAALAGATGVAARAAAGRTEPDEGESEPEPLEFDGEGVTVTDEFEIDDGPTVVEGVHEGESTFFVQIVPRENGQDYTVINHFGEFDGTSGTYVEAGTYTVYVDADGAWELTVRQPRVSADEADEPPLTVSGDGSDWIGPVLFDGTTRVAARYDGEADFGVEVVPEDQDSSEFVWDGGELVFTAIGPFAGKTSVRVDGVGYVDIEATGEWTLELE